jgi:DegV family protein with EDD domain
MTIHIVTDSAAHFVTPYYTESRPITVASNQIVIDGQPFREGVDLAPEDAIAIFHRARTRPVLRPPSVQAYLEIFEEITAHAETIISLHMSRELSSSWANAQSAARQMGHTGIHVVDTGTVCAAQGILVKVAMTALAAGEPVEEIVRQMRGASERLYAMYYVETPTYLDASEILSPAHALLGDMLGLKPFLTIEDGRIVPVEKVRTRTQAIDRLMEFAIEFTDIEDGVVLQPTVAMSDHTRQFQERLSEEFPEQSFPFIVYNPSLAALIGPTATGIVILEHEWEEAFRYED